MREYKIIIKTSGNDFIVKLANGNDAKKCITHKIKDSRASEINAKGTESV